MLQFKIYLTGEHVKRVGSVLLLPAFSSANFGAATTTPIAARVEIRHAAKKSEIKNASWEDWQTVSDAEVAAFAHALADPVRRAVLKLISLWPMRQFELTQIISDASGRRCRDSLISYHLRELERAGLIGFGTTRNEHHAKVVYSKADYRIQLKARSAPEQLKPYARKRVLMELRRALGKKK